MAKKKRKAKKTKTVANLGYEAQHWKMADTHELIVHSCNLDDCLFGKQSRFDFCRHRRIEHHGLITEQTGVVKPLECD